MSITEFYVNNIDPEIDAEQNGTLTKAYLCKSKDCLDLIDVSVELIAAVNSFGPFIAFIVDSGVLTSGSPLSPNQPPARMHLLTGEGAETNHQFGVAEAIMNA